MQETHRDKHLQKRWKSERGEQIYFSNGTTQARGVMILIRKEANCEVNKVIKNTVGRFIALDITHGETRFSLVNLYAPNFDAPGYFKNRLEPIESMENDLKIIAGDLNLVLDNDLDRSGNKQHPLTATTAFIKSYMNAENLANVWRFMNPYTLRYTWFKRNPNPLAERLDYILVAEPLVSLIEDTSIDTSYKSDHGIPWIVLAKNECEKGPGFWKINNSLLNDEKYREEIRYLINQELLPEYESTALRWEMLKLAIRGRTIQYATQKKQERDSRFLEISSERENLEKR